MASAADLGVAIGWTLLATVLSILDLGGALRLAVAIPTLLFIPGYTLLSALLVVPVLPADDPGFQENSSTPSVLERVALSVGLSVAVVPLLALGLNLSPWGLGLVPFLSALGGFILITSGIALARRNALPPEERFQASIRTGSSAWHRMDTKTKLLSVLAVAVIAVAAGTVAYALAIREPSDTFTQFYLLGPGGEAADYPNELAPGENGTLIIGIGNHENTATSYRVNISRVLYNQTPNATVDTNATPLRSEQVTRLDMELADEETDNRTVNFSLPEEGLWRLELDLYRTSPVTDEKAYRELHLWIRVGDA